MLFTDSCRTITCSAVVSINNNFSLGINELPSTLSTLLDNSELVSYNWSINSPMVSVLDSTFILSSETSGF
jgi:hypothetical protein